MPKPQAKMDLSKKKCTSPEFRVSFPHVFEKHSGIQGSEPKYSICMLFNKVTDLKALKTIANNACTEKWGAKEKWPKDLRNPFRDGNEKIDLEGYKDCIFVNATSKQKPGLVDQSVQAIIEPERFYAGCYARATLIAYAYDTMGNKGVAFSLQNIQKTRDGKPFSGRKRAEDEFEIIEDSSESPSSYEASASESDSSTTQDIGF